MRLLQDLPDVDDTMSLADWIELYIFVSEHNLTKTQLQSILSAAGDLDTDSVMEAVDFACKEIRRRSQVSGSNYPFIVNRTTVLYNSSADAEFYKYFLLIAISKPFRDERRQNEVNVTFDEVTGAAVSSYMGIESKFLRFGWPPSPDRPSDFGEAIDWLCTNMGLRRGSGKILTTTNDGGLDVVVWRPFRDGKRPFVVLLLQSTVQQDWLPKAMDVNVDKWLGWLDTGKVALNGIAIPFIIPNVFKKRDELSRTVDVVFDRIRLVSLLEETDSRDFPNVISWNFTEITRMKETTT